MPRARLMLLTLLLATATGCTSSTTGRGTSAVTGAGRPSTSIPAPSLPVPSSSSPSSTARSSTTTRPRSSAPVPPSSTSRRSSGSSSAAAGQPTVVLNPGHDGGNSTHTAEINRLVPAGFGQRKACDTTGTNTDAGYPEHAFTWDVAKRVRRILQAQGIRVVMTRSNDTGVGPCVDERAAIGNRADVAAVVSIHADGAPSSGHGFHVNQDSRRPDGATAAVARQSLALGRALHATLARSSGLLPSTYIGQDGYYYRDDLAGLNMARRPATFLELGNMRNPGDAARLSSASGRARIAAAVAAGILAFLHR